MCIINGDVHYLSPLSYTFRFLLRYRESIRLYFFGWIKGTPQSILEPSRFIPKLTQQSIYIYSQGGLLHREITSYGLGANIMDTKVYCKSFPKFIHQWLENCICDHFKVILDLERSSLKFKIILKQQKKQICVTQTIVITWGWYQK